MKETNCYLCGSSHSQTLFTFRGDDKYLATVFPEPLNVDMNWMICKVCGLVYRSPILEQPEYEKLYSNYEADIFSKVTPDEYFDKIVTLPDGKSENKEKARWLLEATSRYRFNGPLRVLDIGCGGGTLLYTLGEVLPISTACGVELNPSYAELAQRRVTRNIRNQAYESDIFGHKFDLLINTKVLEHIPDPLPFLIEMASDLEPDGLLFIEVPHLSDMYNFPLTDERFTIPHIYFFSEATLEALLLKAGFSVLESRVFKASRNRSYLQTLARKVGEPQQDWVPIEPLDDVNTIISRVQGNKISKISKDGEA